MLLTATGKSVANVLEEPANDAHMPALCDIEVISALRRITRDRDSELTEERAWQAIADLLDLPLTRHSHEGLIERAFELRHNVSAYAVYVALAEKLDARLLTADRALASASLPVGLEVVAV